MQIILGISCYFHDSAACLLIDGQVVAAAQEERFTRIKHDNTFPVNAIGYCLSWADLKIGDVTAVVFYEKPVIKFERILDQYVKNFPGSRDAFVANIGGWMGFKLNLPKTLRKETGYTKKVYFINHHLAHAAGAYYLSGFRDAVIVTLDGVGEWATATVGTGINNRIKTDREIRFPHSLGLFYSALTTYLGFEANDAEYKVMGLAAYGDKMPFREKMNELVNGFPDGSFALNQKYFSFSSGVTMFTRNLTGLFGLPPRRSDSPMTPDYENIAAALQAKLEDTVFNLLGAAAKKYRKKTLCLSGGVALNSVMNGKILTHTPFRKLYIPPDPGDGGCAVGAALYLANTLNTATKKITQFYPSLGPAYSDEQIKTILDQFGLNYEIIPDERQICRTVALLISKKKIIGWFQGRMEWGPRALGFRSILASATTGKMRDIINAKVKHREMFRPFAPVILDRYVTKYFRTDKDIPEIAKFMLLVYPFKPRGIKDVPATVHVDRTGRLQMIKRSDNPLYYDLIREYDKLTGVPVIINTSFNVRGEPIVCSPRDAVQCFLNTDIDHLMIGHYLISKKNR